MQTAPAATEGKPHLKLLPKLLTLLLPLHHLQMTAVLKHRRLHVK
jgi:hypothetical protein